MRTERERLWEGGKVLRRVEVCAAPECKQIEREGVR